MGQRLARLVGSAVRRKARRARPRRELESASARSEASRFLALGQGARARLHGGPRVDQRLCGRARWTRLRAPGARLRDARFRPPRRRRSAHRGRRALPLQLAHQALCPPRSRRSARRGGALAQDAAPPWSVRRRRRFEAIPGHARSRAGPGDGQAAAQRDAKSGGIGRDRQMTATEPGRTRGGREGR